MPSFTLIGLKVLEINFKEFFPCKDITLSCDKNRFSKFMSPFPRRLHKNGFDLPRRFREEDDYKSRHIFHIMAIYSSGDVADNPLGS